MRLVLIVESFLLLLLGAGDYGPAVGVACERSDLMKQAPRALGACRPGEAVGRSRGPVVYSCTQIPEERGLACLCSV